MWTPTHEKTIFKYNMTRYAITFFIIIIILLQGIGLFHFECVVLLFSSPLFHYC